MVPTLASFPACGTWPSSHILMIHRCSLLDKLAPPYFHTSVGISSPSGTVLSFEPLDRSNHLIQGSIDTALLYVFQHLGFYVPRNIESFLKVFTSSCHHTLKLLSVKVSNPSNDFSGVSLVSCVQLYRFYRSFLIVFSLIFKITFDLNIGWSHSLLHALFVCYIPASGDDEDGCVQVVLCASFCFNMMLVTIRSNSVHSTNRGT